LRATVISALGEVSRTPEVLEEVRRRVTTYLRDPGSIEPTTGEVILRLAARAGLPHLYAAVLERANGASNPDDEQRFLFNLLRFETPALLRRTLQLTLSSSVRPQYVMRFVGAAFSEDETRATAWSFVKHHFELLNQRARWSGFGWLVNATAAFCDDRSKEDVLQFFEDPDRRPLRDRRIVAVKGAIETCAALRQRERGPLATWLKHNLPSHL
jgi:hypothetical protein